MNKITREHYPASKLPEDLREGVDPGSTVTVTVTVEELKQSASRKKSLVDMLADARRLPPIGDDPVARIRELRDEWED
ncbi:MAG: hypothetical protein HYX37_12340 [Rhizobiales bacterium]|nr:hypothetical protein [Hyphomicrobiales bacterium]